MVRKKYRQPSEYKRILSLYLKQVRIRKGLTTKHVAGRLGMTVANFWHVEHGKTSLKVEDMPRVAKALGIDLKAILDVILDYSEEIG